MTEIEHFHNQRKIVQELCFSSGTITELSTLDTNYRIIEDQNLAKSGFLDTCIIKGLPNEVDGSLWAINFEVNNNLLLADQSYKACDRILLFLGYESIHILFVEMKTELSVSMFNKAIDQIFSSSESLDILLGQFLFDTARFDGFRVQRSAVVCCQSLFDLRQLDRPAFVSNSGLTDSKITLLKNWEATLLGQLEFSIPTSIDFHIAVNQSGTDTIEINMEDYFSAAERAQWPLNDMALPLL